MKVGDAAEAAPEDNAKTKKATFKKPRIMAKLRRVAMQIVLRDSPVRRCTGFFRFMSIRCEGDDDEHAEALAYLWALRFRLAFVPHR